METGQIIRLRAPKLARRSWRRWPKRARRSARFARDAAHFAAVFMTLFAFGFVATRWRDMAAMVLGELQIILAVGLGAVLTIFGASWRRLWHLFANTFFLSAPSPLARPWVVDGDTIDDLQSGVRYRLANIDAPEIETTCYREAERGQVAKWALVRLVREASTVSVRRTFRTDRYGRRVAFLLIDGADAGRILMQRGFAVSWRGQRRKWCGPKGGLAEIARAGGVPHKCKTCRAL